MLLLLNWFPGILEAYAGIFSELVHPDTHMLSTKTMVRLLY